MSILSTVSKPAARPPIITVVGEAGTGKSSFAASFPKPIFIRIEDGVSRISRKVEAPDVFPVVGGSDALFDQMMALVKEEHDYSTLVLDSVTKLEEVFTREIIEKDGRAKTLSTAMGGYGAGYQMLASMHARVRKAAGVLNTQKQMAIVFIAHADLETMRLPDTDDYQRHSLRLNSKSIAPYVDDVDVVGFVRLSAALRGDDGERKKVVSTGDREFVCHATAASVSKNGLGITQSLPFEEGTNPLADALGITQRMKPKAAKAEDTQEKEPA